MASPSPRAAWVSRPSTGSPNPTNRPKLVMTHPPPGRGRSRQWLDAVPAARIRTVRPRSPRNLSVSSVPAPTARGIGHEQALDAVARAGRTLVELAASRRRSAAAVDRSDPHDHAERAPGAGSSLRGWLELTDESGIGPSLSSGRYPQPSDRRGPGIGAATLECSIVGDETLVAGLYHSVPKVDLHCHVEGCVRPQTVLELARKAGRTLAVEDPTELYRYTSLDSFLAIFWLVQGTLVEPADWERIAYESLIDAAAHGLRYREMFFTPARHLAAGQTLAGIIDGLTAGIEAAEAATRVRCMLIADMDRAYGPAAGRELVEQLAELRHERP